jgi:hypothetical protein
MSLRRRVPFRMMARSRSFLATARKSAPNSLVSSIVVG